MENLASPSEPGKRVLRDAIEHEIQQFLDRGGKITVLQAPSADAARSRGSLWLDGGDDLMNSD